MEDERWKMEDGKDTEDRRQQISGRRQIICDMQKARNRLRQ